MPHEQRRLVQLRQHGGEIAEERVEGVPGGGRGKAVAAEVEGHHVVVAAQQLDQLPQVVLRREEPGAQDQRAAPARAEHRDRDAVVVDLGFCRHAAMLEG